MIIINNKGKLKGKLTINPKFLPVLLSGAVVLTLTGCSLSKKPTEINVTQSVISKEQLNNKPEQEKEKIEAISGPNKAVISIIPDFGSNIISGIELEVKDSNGEVIENFTTSTKEYVLDNLKVGEEYTIEEVGIKPEADKSYYDIGESKYSFKLAEASIPDNNNLVTNYIDIKKPLKQSFFSKEIEDKNGWILVSLVDKTTLEPVPGATYTITDIEGKAIEQWVSTKEKKRILNLSDGDYIISQVMSPANYMLSNESYTFTVKGGSIYVDEKEVLSKEVTFYTEKKLENSKNKPKLRTRKKYAN